MKTDFLTSKQQLFCDEYLTDRNATRAALRAGYSASTALNGQLMNLPKIKLYLQERTQSTAEKAQVDRDMVLAELKKIAFGNLGNFFDADGTIKPMHEVPEDDKAALWSVSVSDTGSGSSGAPVTKFRMYNKLAALDKIAKILDLYTHEIKAPEKEVVYVDKETTTGDDYFDDIELKKAHEVYLDENGDRLYGKNGALPYGPVGEVFSFTIDERPDMTMARLKYYENMQAGMSKVELPFEVIDIRKHLSDWLDGELLHYDRVIDGGHTHDAVKEKFTALREFKRKMDVRVAC